MHGTSTENATPCRSELSEGGGAERNQYQLAFFIGKRSRVRLEDEPRSIPIDVPCERKAMGQTDVDDDVDGG